MDQQKIGHCVDALCERGCRAVTAIIVALERGEPLAEVAHLDADERRAVLAELQSIMAVYGSRCGI